MSHSETIRFTILATYKNLQSIGEQVRTFCTDSATTEMQSPEEIAAIAFDIELAVHEVCNNIIEHAYGNETGQITIHLRYEQRTKSIHIDLFDTGQPFDKADVVLPNLEQPQMGGYGLFLAEHLLDEVTYQQLDRQNVWHLTKRLYD